jgi:hypothetical protein
MKIDVQEIHLSEPITFVGKIFYGDYTKSHLYIQEVQAELDKHAIAWKKNSVFGIFYDDPREMQGSELKSFHGVFADSVPLLSATELTTITLSGKFVYAKAIGSIDSIYEAYQAIFDFLGDKNLQLKSSVGYQVSTFDQGVITTEIYMEL